ncbi:MAG TPA: ABC transporter ATP-binding protein [Pyrinomonadaceae bacterium]
MRAVNESFVRLEAITKRYGDRKVVSNASFEVAEGEFVALLGPSGCGKTTTLRLIAGLETPDAGEIWIAGRRVTADGRNLIPPRSRGIGFVFQDLALWPHLTVTGNLEFVLASAKVPKRERAERIAEAIRLVHIERFARSYPGQLSGGEQQRVALARALIARPRLLLLDEPMSNLDHNLKADLLKELAALQQSLGVTAIYVTHNEDEATTLATRIALMTDGRIELMNKAETQL